MQDVVKYVSWRGKYLDIKLHTNISPYGERWLVDSISHDSVKIITHIRIKRVFDGSGNQVQEHSVIRPVIACERYGVVAFPRCVDITSEITEDGQQIDIYVGPKRKPYRRRKRGANKEAVADTGIETYTTNISNGVGSSHTPGEESDMRLKNLLREVNHIIDASPNRYSRDLNSKVFSVIVTKFTKCRL